MLTPVVIIEIVIALGLIIFVHELGHFLTAKLFGVRVHRFALGMGPIIVKWQRGETEYSLRWIPIGGFVDLAGEHPSAEDGADPAGLCNKPAWQRIVVFSAGVVMNAILAVVLFTVAPLVGVWVTPPVVGDVVKGYPADTAGIKAGDRIVAINGEPVDSFEDILGSVMSSNARTAFTIVVERMEPGSPEPKTLTFKDVRSQRDPDKPAPMIGVAWPAEPVIEQELPESPEEQAGLQVGDRILAVNGQSVTRWQEITQTLAQAPAGPVVLKIQRNGKEEELRIDPAKLKEFKLGMMPPVRIDGVEKGGPADKAGIRVGDRVAAVNGKPWPTAEQLSEAIKSGEAGSTVSLSLWRDGTLVEVACQTAMLDPQPEGAGVKEKTEAPQEKAAPAEKPESAAKEKSAEKPTPKEKEKGKPKPRIGVVLGPAAGNPLQIGNVEPGGAADQAHLQPGDILVAVGETGQRIDQWEKLIKEILSAPDKPTLLQVRRGQTTLTTNYQPETAPLKRFAMDQTAGTPLYVPMPRIVNPVKAAERGLKRTYQMIGRAYVSIKQLATRQVSTEMMAGPVGIMQIAYKIGAKGLGTSIDFWGMLSVFIAVLNFLPVPPFDGGHVLFVFIDAIKGKPVSLKTRQIAWLVGWILVGFLFIFVTFQDVRRVILGF